MIKYCRFKNIPNDNRYSLFVRQKTFDIYCIENGVKRVPWIYLLKELKCAVLSDILNFFFCMQLHCDDPWQYNIICICYCYNAMLEPGLSFFFFGSIITKSHDDVIILLEILSFVHLARIPSSKMLVFLKISFVFKRNPDVRRIVKLVPFFWYASASNTCR